MHTDLFTWHSHVRGYEIDLQGIVNNAVYLQYLDQTRVLYLLSKGVNWEDWHHLGFNLVVAHIDLSFKQSLRQFDDFYVTAQVELQGKLRILFHQFIYKPNSKNPSSPILIAKAIVTCVCVSVATGKPCIPNDLIQKLT